MTEAQGGSGTCQSALQTRQLGSGQFCVPPEPLAWPTGASWTDILPRDGRKAGPTNDHGAFPPEPNALQKPPLLQAHFQSRGG